jgi:hypothetical protein
MIAPAAIVVAMRPVTARFVSIATPCQGVADGRLHLARLWSLTVMVDGKLRETLDEQVTNFQLLIRYILLDRQMATCSSLHGHKPHGVVVLQRKSVARLDVQKMNSAFKSGKLTG